LEVNIKLLRTQIETMDRQLHEAREQVKKEKIDKDHEIEFNKELKKVIKSLRIKLKADQERINQF